MAMRLCFIILIIASFHIIRARRRGKSRKISVVYDTLEILEKAIAYFDSHYNEFNLDALFGLRASEGTLDFPFGIFCYFVILKSSNS